MKYGDENQQNYAIEAPALPMLILVHGGGFVGGTIYPDNFIGWRNFAKERNITVVSIDYRLATPEKASYPEVLNDIKKAHDYLKTNHLPPSITILGSSAGTTIALQAIMLYELDVSFIGFYGLYDLERREDFSDEVNGMIDAYLGNESRFNASPFWSGEMPKSLLFHGTQDKVVSFEQSLLMSAETRLVDKRHSFNIWEHSDEIEAFIKSL